MDTKEGYNCYRLDTGKEQTRKVFKSYETCPEDVLIKLHGKYISEMKTAVKLKRSMYDDEPLVNLRRSGPSNDGREIPTVIDKKCLNYMSAAAIQ